MDLKNKKVLLVGLGILGGGLSMAKYFVSKGAKLTVTDLRDKKTLEPTLKKLPTGTKTTIGKHLKGDFDKADVIVFNPAVPAKSEWAKYAKSTGKPFYNDYTFFLENKKDALVVGITGTRGKTTTALWANQLIEGSVLGGNIPEANLLKILNKRTDVYVLELSSFQLEHATAKTPAPDIAVLTNVYVDHLNRYGSLENYKKVKFNIFKNQTKDDVLILNADETITKEVMALKPKAQIFYVSQKVLPKTKNGLYFNDDEIFYQYNKQVTLATKVKGLAPHEKINLLTAMLVAHLVGVSGQEINNLIKDLPQPMFREQVILKNRNYKIINDSAATSPEATIAAIEKFKKDKNFVLICGGTNKELDFKELAKKIKKDVRPENLFLLEGSATNLLIKELSLLRSSELVAYENLEDIIDVVSQEFGKATLVFSPGAASFEKFKNEFDRGEKFNKLVRKYFV